MDKKQLKDRIKDEVQSSVKSQVNQDNTKREPDLDHTKK